jgi:hypothetical protein
VQVTPAFWQLQKRRALEHAVGSGATPLCGRVAVFDGGAKVHRRCCSVCAPSRLLSPPKRVYFIVWICGPEPAPGLPLLGLPTRGLFARGGRPERVLPAMVGRCGRWP